MKIFWVFAPVMMFLVMMSIYQRNQMQDTMEHQSLVLIKQDETIRNQVDVIKQQGITIKFQDDTIREQDVAVRECSAALRLRK